MGDDAEYEMERLEEERFLHAAQGPRDIQDILENMRASIASAKAQKASENRNKRA